MVSTPVHRRVNGARSLKLPPGGPSRSECAMRSSGLINRFWTTPGFARSTRWKSIGDGVKRIYPTGSAMGAFDYKQAEEIRDVFRRRGVRYLFIGKSGAILLGFPDTTQDADLFVEKNAMNCERI